ncbi:MAG: carboxypeptidase regulatory-like domain-containing protein, partial [Planctomycetes bacterium]|nr:carboxypeptidase regulatory-like domain-containing protein [Planctomycetota bacterium]
PEGVAVIEGVMTGLWLPVLAKTRDGRFETVSGIIQGPERAGDVKRYDLVLDRTRGALRFRVLDPQGSLFPSGERLHAEIVNQNGAQQRSWMIPVDELGRVTVPIPLDWVGDGQVEIRLARFDIAQTRLVRGPAEGVVVDLDDLVLQAARPLVSGRVADREGRPVAGLSVLAWREPFGTGETHLRDRDRDSPFATRKTTTDAQGRFQLEAPPFDGDWHLDVRQSGGIGLVRVDFEAGTTGLPVTWEGR